MQYLKLDGSAGECEAVAPSFEALRENVDDETVYHLPRVNEHASLHDLVTHVMGIISMKPFYIAESDIPWMLAYLDGLRSFLEQTDTHEFRFGYDRNILKRYSLSGTRYTYNENNDPKPNFVELSRRFACIDVLLSHLYGFEMATEKESDDPENEHVDREYIIIAGALFGLDQDSRRSIEQCPADSLDFIYERQFKTGMSQDYFKRSIGFLRIPEGMQIHFDFDTDGVGLKEGDSAMFEVDRFFTTQGGWRDDYDFAGFPAVVNNVQKHAFRFIPILKSNLGGKKRSLTESILIHVPISWITHVIQLPHGFYDREFSVQRVTNHEYPPVVDEKYELMVYEYVESKANKEADEMEELLRKIHPNRR